MLYLQASRRVQEASTDFRPLDQIATITTRAEPQRRITRLLRQIRVRRRNILRLMRTFYRAVRRLAHHDHYRPFLQALLRLRRMLRHQAYHNPKGRWGVERISEVRAQVISALNAHQEVETQIQAEMRRFNQTIRTYRAAIRRRRAELHLRALQEATEEELVDHRARLRRQGVDRRVRRSLRILRAAQTNRRGALRRQGASARLRVALLRLQADLRRLRVALQEALLARDGLAMAGHHLHFNTREPPE